MQSIVYGFDLFLRRRISTDEKFLHLNVTRIQEEYSVCHRAIASRPTGFLIIGLDRTWNIVMDHCANIRLVDAHSERACRHDHARMSSFIPLLSARDIEMQKFLIRANSPTEEEVKSVYNTLHEIAGNAVG